jgi:dihydrofolate synthase/folylpolyglutamate synthase
MAQILFPLFDRVIIAPIHTARAAAATEVLAAAQATGTQAVAVDSVNEALQVAQQTVGAGPVVISGSVYLVGEARSLLLGEEGLQP